MSAPTGWWQVRAAVAGEWRKVRRSRVPAITLLAFTVAPAIGGLFMFIVANPDRARRLGLLGQKAQLAGLSADWPGLLMFSAQVVAVGSLLAYAFIITWLFGREFTDGTAHYLMALPVTRSWIVTAKLLVYLAWAALLALWLVTVTAAIGAAMDLPGWSAGTAGTGVARILVAATLMAVALTPLAWVASRARGYLTALSTALVMLAGAQIAAVLGWGNVVPWAVPALAAGLAPGQHATATSIALCIATGLAGAAAAIRWWNSPEAGL
ncbi:MAG: ABC transporter permease [Candidatus Nanopelagicales bacterium]